MMKKLVLTILVLFALGSAENSQAETKQLIHLDIFDQKSVEIWHGLAADFEFLLFDQYY